MSDFSFKFWQILSEEFRMPTIKDKEIKNKKSLYEIDPFDLNIDSEQIIQW